MVVVLAVGALVDVNGARVVMVRLVDAGKTAASLALAAAPTSARVSRTASSSFRRT